MRDFSKQYKYDGRFIVAFHPNLNQYKNILEEKADIISAIFIC